MPMKNDLEKEKKEYLNFALKIIEANSGGFSGGLLHLTDELIESAKKLEKFIKE